MKSYIHQSNIVKVQSKLNKQEDDCCLMNLDITTTIWKLTDIYVIVRIIKKDIVYDSKMGLNMKIFR